MAYDDTVRTLANIAERFKPGEVYNIGGGRENSASVLECISLIEELIGQKIDWTYDERNRAGDHICYITNLKRLKTHYLGWSVTRNLTDICREMVETTRQIAAKENG